MRWGGSGWRTRCEPDVRCDDARHPHPAPRRAPVRALPPPRCLRRHPAGADVRAHGQQVRAAERPVAVDACRGASSASHRSRVSPWGWADAHAPSHSSLVLSGAGKTTLLDCASQRRSQGRLSGSVLLDGAVPSLATLKSRTAYIQQDDALFGYCSIAETLGFAAKMKLKGASTAQCSKAVEDALSQMSLQLARNTLIGSRLTRGCSGGERKRTSVATGLLGKPSWCAARCASARRADSGCIPSAQPLCRRANLWSGQRECGRSDGEPEGDAECQRLHAVGHHPPAQPRRLPPLRRPGAAASWRAVLLRPGRRRAVHISGGAGAPDSSQRPCASPLVCSS